MLMFCALLFWCATCFKSALQELEEAVATADNALFNMNRGKFVLGGLGQKLRAKYVRLSIFALDMFVRNVNMLLRYTYKHSPGIKLMCLPFANNT